MKKQMTSHGQKINGIYLSCQLINGIPKCKAWLDNGSLQDWQVRHELLSVVHHTVYFVHFNSLKAFVDQMTFADGTTLGFQMKQLYTSCDLREI